MNRNFLFGLLFFIALVLLWSGYSSGDQRISSLEVIPAMLGILLIMFTLRKKG
jgi:uncharacterized membrane protein YjdF